MNMQKIIAFLWTINIVWGCLPPAFDNVTVQSNFNLRQFLGTWYEIKWYKNETETHEQMWNDYVQIFQMDTNSSDRLLANGYARLSKEKECFPFEPWSIIANNSAKMFVERSNLTGTNKHYWPYYIVRTDYNHYALIYGCMSENYMLNNTCLDPMLWMFSRTVVLSREDLIDLDQYIKTNLCMNLNELRISLHSAKSCHGPTSFASQIQSNVFVHLLILYFFLAYK